MHTFHILRKVNINITCAQFKGEGPGMREMGGRKGSFKIGQQESSHMPKGAEVCWTAWIFIFAHRHFPQAQTRPVFVANSMVTEVADMLVIIDEKTKKANCAVCWVSFLFSVKWHLTISSFHSTFHSRF